MNHSMEEWKCFYSRKDIDVSIVSIVINYAYALNKSSDLYAYPKKFDAIKLLISFDLDDLILIIRSSEGNCII